MTMSFSSLAHILRVLDEIAGLHKLCTVFFAVAAGPRRHEKTFDTFRGDVLLRELDDHFEILRHLVV